MSTLTELEERQASAKGFYEQAAAICAQLLKLEADLDSDGWARRSDEVSCAAEELKRVADFFQKESE